MASEPIDNRAYIVIPESLANLLDGSEVKSMSFTQSSADEADAGLPTEAELAAIKTTTLSPAEAIKAEKAERMGRTIYPVVEYFPALMTPDWEIQSAVGAVPGSSPTPPGSPPSPSKGPLWSVRVLDRASGKPIADAVVTAFMGTALKNGIQAVTDSNGDAFVPVPANACSVRQLFVHPQHSHWSRHEQHVPVASKPHVVELDSFAAVNGSALSIIAQGPAAQASRGAGVRVGIIDTGVGPHPDIQLAGGAAPVSEPGGTYGDRDFHGTHVAGLIAGKGGQFPGLAPDCEVYSYRVFKPGVKGALNSDLVAALFRAMQDGCHIVNMSLGSTKGDRLVEKTIRLAMSRGVLVVAASGNDSSKAKRAPIRSPAKVKGVVSVSAMGCQNSYPRDSAHVIWECTPTGAASSHFVASFSNAGKSLDCTAPGVGLVSTVPGGYSAQDGTSMAAPIVTGIAACRISADPHALGLPADENRTLAFRSLLYTASKSLGFASHLEGKNGLPQ